MLAFKNTLVFHHFKIHGNKVLQSKLDDDNGKKQDRIKSLYKLQWFLYNIAATMSVGVTLYYWTFDYTGTGISLSDLNVHILNAVFMVVEHIFSSMPWRILHVVYPMLFTILYTKVTVFYWMYVDGQPMYAVLDYSNRPGLAALLVFGGLFVVLPAIHFLLYLIYRLRLYFVGRKLTEKTKNFVRSSRAGKVHSV